MDGLDIYENKNSLRLPRIIVKKEFRGSGVGSKIMNDLIGYADKNKQIITLTPSSDFGGNKNRLIQFYKSFGFKHNQGQYKNFEFNDSMIRYPKLNETMKPVIKQLLRESLNESKFLFKEETEIESCDCCKYFDMNNLGGFYGALEKPIYFMVEKNRIDTLKYITPENYIHAIAKGFGVSYSDAIKDGNVVDIKRAKKYAEEMINGAKFPVGYYRDGESGQEGRHRALACIELGCKYIPVVVIKTISNNNVKKLLTPLIGMSFDDLNNKFKEMGYNGITDLDYNTFKRRIDI